MEKNVRNGQKIYSKQLLLRILFFSVLICSGAIARAQYANGIVVEKLLTTDTTAVGQKIMYPCFGEPEVTMLKITIPPGKSTGWHKHSFPVFSYIIQGTLTVELENHRVIQCKENTTYAEMVNTYHNGSNREDSDLVVIAIYLGVKREMLSIPNNE